MSAGQIALSVVFGAATLVGFCAMGVDKYCAVHGQWRIKEKTLFAIAAAMGGAGAALGMYAFRHKTRHRAFAIGLPLSAAVDVALYVAGMILMRQ